MLKTEKYKKYTIKFKKIKGLGVLAKTKIFNKPLYRASSSKTIAFENIKDEIDDILKEGTFKTENKWTRRYNEIWDSSR